MAVRYLLIPFGALFTWIGVTYSISVVRGDIGEPYVKQVIRDSETMIQICRAQGGNPILRRANGYDFLTFDACMLGKGP